ncbi:MAG: fibronectin type III domain-containing protein [Ruminococcus sp.]|nr:fibronectin type III domain-containing protein [Ruminococcus sp.]
MLDLDKKRQTLKKLREKGKSNFLLFLPCLIAYFFVSVYYFFALHIDMLLSDKDGRFLGIEKKEKSKAQKSGDSYTPSGSRIKTSTRLVSAFLMVCFAFTFLPTIGVDTGLAIPASAAEPITVSNAQGVIVNGTTYYVTTQELNATYDTPTLSWANKGFGYTTILLQPMYNSASPLDADYTGVRLYQAVNGGAYSESNQYNFDPRAISEGTPPVQTSNLNEVLVENLVPTNVYSYYAQAFVTIPKYQKIVTPEVPAEYEKDANGDNVVGSDGNWVIKVPAKPEVVEFVLDGTYELESSRHNTEFYSATPGALQAAPGNIRADNSVPPNASPNNVTLTWEQSLDAHGYIVWRTNRDTGRQEYIKTVTPGTTLTTTDTLPMRSTIYDYTVMAYRGITPAYDVYRNNGADKYYVLSDNKSLTYDTATVVSQIDTPVAANIPSSVLQNSIFVDWNDNQNIAAADSDSAGYLLYRVAQSDIDTAFANTQIPSDDVSALSLAQLKSLAKLTEPILNTDSEFSDLTADISKEYHYVITAYRKPFQDNLESDALIITTRPANRPPKIQNVQAATEDRRAFLFWTTLPAGQVERYEISYWELDDGGNRINENAPAKKNVRPNDLDFANNNAYELTGLSNGVRYEVNIAAVNDASIYSDPSNSVKFTVGGTPDRPVIGTLVSSPNTITVPWNKVVADDYLLERGEPDENGIVAAGGWTQIVTVDTTYPDDGLTNNKSYRYRVTARKTVGTGKIASGQLVTEVKSSPVSLPQTGVAGVSVPPPTDGKVAVSGNTANITWKAGVKGINDVEVGGYWVYIRDASGTNVLNSPFETTATSYSLDIPGDTADYSVYVAAYQSGFKNIRSDEIIAGRIFFEPTILQPPTDLQAKPSTNSIALSWNASPTTGVTGYVVYGGLSSSSLSRLGTTTTNAYTHNNLGIGETWYYYVKSFRNKPDGTMEESPRASDLASATTGTGGTDGVVFPPTDFRGTLNENTVDLSWTASKGSVDGYYIYTKPGKTVTSTDYTKRFNTAQTSYNHDDPVSGENSYVLVAYKYNALSGQYLYSEPTEIVTKNVGAKSDTDSARLPAPLDFEVTTTDGRVELSWSAVPGATSYRVHASGPTGSVVFDRTAPGFEHTPLLNGEKWTYYVTANTGSGTGIIEGVPTQSYSVTVGVTMNQPTDFRYTAGNRQIDLEWSAVTGAQGYIVYQYNQSLLQFEPIAVVSEPKYSAMGLTNGLEYTYMVAAYKTINGRQFLSPYSMSITAVPTTGSPTDLDRKIMIRGTAPYGMDRSDLMSAAANHGAFNTDVDIFITTREESTLAIRNALSEFANGLDSFVVYPFDITLYQAGTYIEAVLNDGYTVTITLPLPDELVRYRDYIQVMHLDSNGTLENLRSSLAEIEGQWCIQFPVLSFSPFAFVIYKDQIVDAASGTGSFGWFSSNAFGQILNFPQAMLPFGIRLHRARRKVYRIRRIERKL